MPKSSRDLLIDAAEKSLILYGSDQTSIKQIARIAGVNHGLVHHYFSSKEDLFIAVLNKNNGAFCDGFNQIKANNEIEMLLSERIKPNLILIIEMISLACIMPELNIQLKKRFELTRNIIGEHFNIKNEKKQRILMSSMLGFAIHSKVDLEFNINEAMTVLVDSLRE